MTATYTREQATALEDDYAARTRRAVLDSGRWPKSLPLWPADQSATPVAHTP